jgi:hypothetical protein
MVLCQDFIQEAAGWPNLANGTGQMKMKLSSNLLDGAYPKEFSIFLTYTHTLDFDDKPNYKYLHNLFRNLFVHEGYQYDDTFNWCMATTNLGTPSGGKANTRVKGARNKVAKEKDTPRAISML